MNNLETIKSMCMGMGLSILMLFPVLVQASCVLEDMPGTWMTYGVSGDTFYGEMSSTDRCKIKVNSSGSIVGSASYCKYRDRKGVHNLDVASGKMEVNSNCVITGTLRLCRRGVCVKQIIENGTLSTEKNVFSIVGYSKPDPDLVFSFTGLKR